MRLIKQSDRMLVIIAVVILVIIFLPYLLIAQSKIMNLDLARFYVRVDQGHSEPHYTDEHTGMFPNGTHNMWAFSSIKEGWLFGHIILANGEEVFNYRQKLYDDSGYLAESPFGVWEISKYPPPKVFVDGIEATKPYKDVVDPTVKADKMYRIYKKCSPWMHLYYEGYQFVNQYYGDFIIVNSTYKLTFDDDHFPEMFPDPDADTTQTVEKFYIYKGYQCGETTAGGWMNEGKWFINHGAMWGSTMLVPSIVSGCDRKDLIVSYSWDGDDPDLITFITGGPLFDDTGDPRWKPVPDGELISSAYGGFALLHCDKSAADKMDDVAQNPYTSRVMLNTQNWYGEAQFPGSKKAWDYFIAPGYGIFEVSTLEEGTDSNPTTVEGKNIFQVWGGWDLQMGDSVTTVHAVGVGSISRKEAREVGSAWAHGYNLGDVPQAHYNDVLLGDAFVTDAVKNQILARGRDSLALTMQRAQELWENNLECPRPYPSPDLYVSSGPYSVTLEWEDIEARYPDHDGGHVIAYRIYRKKGHFEDAYTLEAGKNLYWERIAEIPVEELMISSKGLYTYLDAGLSIGEDYHYAVTAVSDKRCGIDGTGPYLESSQWSNRSLLPAKPFVPGKTHLDSIAVVPNPYYIQGQLINFASDNNQLMFVNLPPYCTLRIFNVTGDLIHTIYHDNGSSNDYWDQITQHNQYIASGVYILVVTDAKRLVADNEGNLTIPEEMPGKAIVKFTIIR